MFAKFSDLANGYNDPVVQSPSGSVESFLTLDVDAIVRMFPNPLSPNQDLNPQHQSRHDAVGSSAQSYNASPALFEQMASESRWNDFLTGFWSATDSDVHLQWYRDAME